MLFKSHMINMYISNSWCPILNCANFCYGPIASMERAIHSRFARNVISIEYFCTRILLFYKIKCSYFSLNSSYNKWKSLFPTIITKIIQQSIENVTKFNCFNFCSSLTNKKYCLAEFENKKSFLPSRELLATQHWRTLKFPMWI